jgi:hypothetical protein
MPAWAEMPGCALQFSTCAAIADRIGPGGSLDNVNDASATAWFDGFVWGVAFSYLQKGWCPRQPFNGWQLSAVVSKYVRENPRDWGKQPATLVLKAPSEAFPCKQ